MMFKRNWTTSSDFIDYFTLVSEHDWEDLLYVFSYEINKRALMITVTRSRERSTFPSDFLLMLPDRSANVRHILLKYI